MMRMTLSGESTSCSGMTKHAELFHVRPYFHIQKRVWKWPALQGAGEQFAIKVPSAWCARCTGTCATSAFRQRSSLAPMAMRSRCGVLQICTTVHFSFLPCQWHSVLRSALAV